MSGRCVLRKLLEGVAAVGLLAAALAVSPVAHAKGGGGFALAAAGGGSKNNPYGLFGVGGEGVLYPVPILRVGAEAYGLTSQVGSGLKGGVFGDFVLARIANADLFLGSAIGLGAGNPLGGAALYVRPEFGVQWNLGRTAIEARLNLLLAAPLSQGQDPAQFVGLNVGLLFGDFPVASVRGPGRTPRSPRHTPPPPRRTPPPPPPPRR